MNQILPWIRDATLAASLCAIATGDRAVCWMGCVRDRMFPVSKAASPIEMVVLYAAWRAGAPADQLAPEARRLAHQRIGVRGWALLYTLSTGLGDANLLEAVRHFRVMSEFGSGPEHVAKIEVDELHAALHPSQQQRPPRLSLRVDRDKVWLSMSTEQAGSEVQDLVGEAPPVSPLPLRQRRANCSSL